MTTKLTVFAEQGLSMLNPPWLKLARWKEANLTFEQLIKDNHKDLGRAKELAISIKKSLQIIFPWLEDLAKDSCSRCLDPCCLRAKPWIDFRDLLLLHLIKAPIPVRQLLALPSDTCFYLGPNGCLLPRISRPWICTWYLCPIQKEILRKKPLDLQRSFDHYIDSIKKKRKYMEIEFIKIVAP